MDVIFDLPPAFGMAVILVAGVASFRMMRGHRWDTSIRSGVRAVLWVGGTLLVLSVSTWLFGAWASFAITPLVIAVVVLWRRLPPGSRQSRPGHAPGLAKVVAGTGPPARIR